MVDNITTIKISKKTKDRLKNLQVYKNETYEEIIERILEIFNICRFNPDEAKRKLISIDEQKKLIS